MTDEAREDVWLAMSDLFLDTDVSLHRDYILRRLRASPFDLATLEQIFIEEVYPVCIFNLRDVAGEWAGFPRDWLISKIEAYRRRHGRPGRIKLWLRWRGVDQLVSEWAQIRAELLSSET